MEVICELMIIIPYSKVQDVMFKITRNIKSIKCYIK